MHFFPYSTCFSFNIPFRTVFSFTTIGVIHAFCVSEYVTEEDAMNYAEKWKCCPGKKPIFSTPYLMEGSGILLVADVSGCVYSIDTRSGEVVSYEILSSLFSSEYMHSEISIYVMQLSHILIRYSSE